MQVIDNIDKSILNRIQSNFPVSPRPFLDIANELHLSEDETLLRVQRLKTIGVIRRIGGNFVPGKLGYASTLCAASVPEHAIENFADVVNSYPGVTHNYVRGNNYNVWFTFIAPSMPLIRRYLEEISLETGISDILNLPATRVFKIRAHFNL